MHVLVQQTHELQQQNNAAHLRSMLLPLLPACAACCCAQQAANRYWQFLKLTSVEVRCRKVTDQAL
jgi:hypothetical protein